MRNLKIDFYRGVAIFLMVYAHILQFGKCIFNAFMSGQGLNSFIYSFHMPILAIISGYCCALSIQKYTCNLKKYIINRSLSLLSVILVWGTIYFLLDFIFIKPTISLSYLIFRYFTGQLWFITGIIFLNVITIIIYHFCNKNKFASWVMIYSLVTVSFFVMALFIPHINPICYLMPFYFIGFLYNAPSSYHFKMTINKIAPFGVIIFIILFFTFGFNLALENNNVYCYFYKACCCCIFVLLLNNIYYHFQNSKIITFFITCGKYSIQIYTMHWIIILYALKEYELKTYSEMAIFQILVSPVFSITICALIIILSKLVLKKQKLSRLLFGR